MDVGHRFRSLLNKWPTSSGFTGRLVPDYAAVLLYDRMKFLARKVMHTFSPFLYTQKFSQVHKTDSETIGDHVHSNWQPQTFAFLVGSSIYQTKDKT